MADLAPLLSPPASRNKCRVAARVATLDGAARGIPPLHAAPASGAAEPPWTPGSRALLCAAASGRSRAEKAGEERRMR